MKRFSDSRVASLLLLLMLALMVTAGSAKADFTFGERTNLEPTINRIMAKFNCAGWET